MYFILKFSMHAIRTGFTRGWMYDKAAFKDTQSFSPRAVPAPTPRWQSRRGTQSGEASPKAWSLHHGNKALEPCRGLGLRKGH